MGVFDSLLTKSKLSDLEKLVLLRELLKREMDLLNRYCELNSRIPRNFALELCHLHNIKKVNIAKILSMIKTYDPGFMETLVNADPRVRRYISYYFEFINNHPYFEEVLEPQNLFGNWDYIRYKLKILFPDLTMDEIDRFRFKRREFIEYVKSKTGESEDLIEEKLMKATWYESVPYLELESEMDSRWHPEPVMTEDDWQFIRANIRGRKNLIVKDGKGKEKLVYVEVDIPDQELDKYKRDREGLKKLLMERYALDEHGAEQILRKAGWESENYHIIPPLHTDAVADWGKPSAKRNEKEERKTVDFSISELTAHIRTLGGMELELLNYWELIQGKLREVKETLITFIRMKRRILGKLFGIYYSVDPVMAEAILTYDPETVQNLRHLVIQNGVRNKKFTLSENGRAWNEVKRRIVARFPEVSPEEVDKYRGKRDEFISFLSEKLGKERGFIERKLEEAGWHRDEEIPAFLRQIGP
jgi:hypothetical protein